MTWTILTEADCQARYLRWLCRTYRLVEFSEVSGEGRYQWKTMGYRWVRV